MTTTCHLETGVSTNINNPPGVRWPESIVCFGGEDWWYHNRGHCDIQFMRQYARHGRVLYVNSVVMRKPNVSEGAMFWKRLARKTRSIFRGLVHVDDNFTVYSPVTAPVHHLPWARPINEQALRQQVLLAMRRLQMRKPLVWVNCPAACDTALALPRSGLVYQRTDRYEDHPGVDVEQITRYDRTLKRQAGLTFYSNRNFCEEESDQCRQAAYVEHGVDYELFAEAELDPQSPPEMQDLKRPIIGFFGGIDDHKFNLPLAAEVAARLPELTFVFVGKASIDTGPLESLPNVVLTGQQPYEQIPHYGKGFDVCIMPFRQSRWIEAMNPIKLKEYLALGKPIVTTRFGELAGYAGLIHVAENAGEFAAGIQQALADISPEATRVRRERVLPHSWHSKAEQVLGFLDQDRAAEFRIKAPA